MELVHIAREAFRRLGPAVQITFDHVRAHQGHPGSEYADSLAGWVSEGQGDGRVCGHLAVEVFTEPHAGGDGAPWHIKPAFSLEAAFFWVQVQEAEDPGEAQAAMESRLTIQTSYLHFVMTNVQMLGITEADTKAEIGWKASARRHLAAAQLSQHGV